MPDSPNVILEKTGQMLNFNVVLLVLAEFAVYWIKNNDYKRNENPKQNIQNDR